MRFVVEPLQEEIDVKNAEISAIRSQAKDGKLSDDENKKSDELEKAVNDARGKMSKAISEYAVQQPLVKQLIDLALLGNGLLKGQQLSEFIRRSVELL